MDLTTEASKENAPARNDPTGARLARIQAWSGLLFTLFLTAHLANQATAALGDATYDATQRYLRRAYQSTPLELPLVIGPFLVHVAAAVMRMVTLRRRRASSANLTARMHRLSGIVLLIFFAGHVAATRGASLFYGVYPGFQGIAFTLHWTPTFWPYWLLLGTTAVYHLVYGLSVALPIVGAPFAVPCDDPEYWSR